ncbi:endonuclease/exonuclease/phosphatase family protein [Brevibacillus sp. 179-C 1.1 NHS]|uniref:endonuclease/exonuclease/phosphatase family protein n=1 Tax=Brevibacillus sp. 179-C 1.1 NHS TaxID=3235177 RepID=UPI00399FC54E
MRVVSYNIHSGRDLWWRKRLTEMTRTLHDLQPDLIALQEVHQNGKYGYQASYIADQLQYHLAFAPSITISDGHYGNALLSRYTLENIDAILLPARKEQRTLLLASFQWQGRTITACVTHCSLNQVSRQAQLQLMSALIHQHAKTPLLLMGDFNASHVSFTPHLMDCALVSGQEKKPTLPAFRRRLDYIFASRHWNIDHYELLPVNWSDHVPVIADLSLPVSPVRGE